MRSSPISNVLARQDGSVTVEFVAVIGAFMLLTFFIMEIVVAVLWVGTAEKAAQLGARLAVVATPGVTATATCPAGAGLPLINCLKTTDPNAHYGMPCPTNCTAWASSPVTCAGGSGSCNATYFSAIVSQMTGIAPLLTQGCTLAQPGCHVTISYANSQLGFAGGPTIPNVTVTISGVPYGAVITTILGNFFGGSPILTVLPDISVTLTGEDLSSAGA